MSQGEIGRGNFGTVCRGLYEKNDNDIMEVAIKTFNSNDATTNQLDFEREIEIMKVKYLIKLILNVIYLNLQSRIESQAREYC